ncbi:MAG: hypothetical protein RBS19_03575 [Bacteroidales bacterium]|nr:hypothetical protein [Bacteroidales bacterium]MDY0216019.1 hypothetical protein [Bacteroidales bacterium]
MKKTLVILSIFAITAISMSSCKKEYVCECTSNYAQSPPSNYSKIIYATKYEAKLECENTNETVFNTIMTCKLK